MSLYVAICLVYAALASALIAVMAGKRVLYSSPVFFAYVCFDLGAAVAVLAIYQRGGHSGWYWYSLLFAMLGDFLLYFWVLAELGANLLRANRESPPHWGTAVMLFVFALILFYNLSQWAPVSGHSLFSNLYYLGLRANANLQFAGFLALIAWGNLLKLRWPDRELRIASGLGFCSFVWFIVALLHAVWNAGPGYLVLDQIAQIASLATLAYWLHYFWIEAKPEARLRKAASRQSDDPSRHCDSRNI